MTSLSPHDLQWAIHRLPRKVAEVMKARPNALFLAGGYIRANIAHEPVNDIDLFVSSAADAGAVAMEIAGNDPKLLHKTDNAITVKAYKTPVQVIHRWLFDDPRKCLESFDFTIAAAAIYHDGKEFQGVCADGFYQDLAAKRLVYTSPVRNEEAGGSLLRVLKFYQRGYRIPLGSFGAVIGRLLSGIDEDKLKDRKGMTKEEWGQQIGHVVTGLLHEVDPRIDPEHLAHLPDIEPAPQQPV